MFKYFRIYLRKLLSIIVPRRLVEPARVPGDMTIPSRPAPAPPGSRGQSAAAGANASLDQLRLQLQQQHLQQQQQSHGGSLQKLTIKLPPPPRGPLQQQQSLNAQHKRSNNNNLFEVQTGSSITRKFPQARYTPTTNWDDDPFGGGGGGAAANGNGNFRKMPPPRPPPPKVQVQVNGQKIASTGQSATSTGGGGSLISNIFHRKKTSSTAAAAASKAVVQSRVYGLSSGHAGTTAPTAAAAAAAGSGGFSNTDWNAAWNTATTTAPITSSSSSSSSAYYSQTTSNAAAADGQLISFDSPPSSPTFTQKSNSDCVSVDSFSSDSNFSSPHNGSVSQPESGFEDDYHRLSRPATQSPLDPWEAVDSGGHSGGVDSFGAAAVRQTYQTSNQVRSSDNPLCNGKSLLPPTQSLTMPTIIKPKISQKPKAPRAPPFVGGMPPGYGGAFNPPSPPMPKGAPPPLPSSVGSAAAGISMLDVIAGRVDAMALSNGCSGYVEEEVNPYAIALYDFDGVEEGDLSFRENEKIYLLDQPTPEWMRGRTRSGCEGIFPVTYVDIKVPLGAGVSQSHPQAQAPPQQQQQQQQTQQHQSQNNEPTALCLYHFPGGVEGDLPLQENELVTVLYRINEEWLFGEAGGRQGQFPANFLDQVPDNLPTL
ncbi:uncharacterized protein l(3)05822 isoform X1 [Drosophila pseudoobscura]|uniref:Uncharacterized protein l(3)05822 isoform X1 n=2 Tax=Drosophila pseudoobscura pseudoobscura TaxID=46245 RepID=A0A6I8VC32_DROPS|nr:uncharacterized protein LOC4802854 isoform X1 [Drosophila pseudoobscura]